MSGAMLIVERGVEVLTDLAFIGAPFLLWGRSKTAAILGACAGACQLLTVLVFIVIDLASGKGVTPMGVRLVYAFLSWLGNVGLYGFLTAMVVVLARSSRAVAR